MLNSISASPLPQVDTNFRWSPQLTLAQIAQLPRTEAGLEADALAVQAHSALFKMALALSRASCTLDHSLLHLVA